MHFHLPKPIHGWRALLGEVLIIVVGVLIALAAEQVVETMHWRHKVAEARQELRYEIGHNLQLMKWRDSESACVDRRLDELSLALNQASSTGKLPPLGKIGSPGSGTFPTAVWQSQVSAETATHFSAVELGSIGRIYRFIELARDIGSDDVAAWRALSSMVGPGRSVDPATVQHLAEALVVARQLNHIDGFYAQQIRTIMTQSGLGADFGEVDPKNPPVLGGAALHAMCEPIGQQVPPGYGWASPK